MHFTAWFTALGPMACSSALPSSRNVFATAPAAELGSEVDAILRTFTVPSLAGCVHELGLTNNGHLDLPWILHLLFDPTGDIIR